MKSRNTLVIAAVVLSVTIGAAAPAAAHSASAPLTKAKATAIAKSINLRASDLPGDTAKSAKPTAAEQAAAAKYSKCIGLASDFVDVGSSAFENSSGYALSSEVAFVSSLAALKQDARRSMTPHAQQCFKQQLAAAATAAGAPSPDVTITPINEAPASGLDAAFAFKFTATFSVFGQTVHIYGYNFAFGRGNAQVSLEEIGATNLPQSDIASPLAALISRAKQQVPAAGLKVS